MKFLLLLTLTAAPAFAAEIPPTALAQALVDKSESITKVKNDCSSGIRDVSSEEIEPGVFRHTLSLGRISRGPGNTCRVEIMQDFRPTYSDGPIGYEILVTETSAK